MRKANVSSEQIDSAACNCPAISYVRRKLLLLPTLVTWLGG